MSIAGCHAPSLIGKCAACRRAELQSSFTQDGSHHVLDAAHFVQHRAARHQKRTPQPALPALDVNLSEPACPHDLSQSAGIVAIGLVRHGLHGGVRLSRLNADRRQLGGNQLVVQPGRHGTGLHADALQRKANLPQGGDQRTRIARSPQFLDDASRLVDDADRGFFQGHVHSGIIDHGCFLSMLVAISHGPRSIILEGAATPATGTPITPSDTTRTAISS